MRHDFIIVLDLDGVTNFVQVANITRIESPKASSGDPIIIHLVSGDSLETKSDMASIRSKLEQANSTIF